MRDGKKSLLYMKCGFRLAREVLNYDWHVIVGFFF